jgi:nucleotide-binding universal stress UspA family protein
MQHALALATLVENPVITGTHAYAAKLHDTRFRQMEGGLPEQFREEEELERQRDVHDDLISRGLSIITDCYLDQAERACEKANITFVRSSLEGKNYRVLTDEANSGRHELLVMGSLGLGAVEGSRLGTVCQRVTRRSRIDTLIIKEPDSKLSAGPIVVAIDGSAKAYGGLVTALSLAREWKVKVKVVSVFDPYFHYVAFNRIAGVLSDEAGKVFRFKEQEQLHEEIIDSGLAKIYQAHLDVAKAIAEEMGVDIETVLLDGKPHAAIEKYLHREKPSLLVIGKLGIHADSGLDIGGNAENLLFAVDCAVLLSQREYSPKLDVVADVTTSWTKQAEQAMEAVPEFARNMARMAILRYAQQEGHTVITEKIVHQATVKLCPMASEAMGQIVAAHDAGGFNTRKVDKEAKGFTTMHWSTEAEQLLQQLQDPSVRENMKHRAEKKARTEKSDVVRIDHIKPFLNDTRVPASDEDGRRDELHWQAMALARLMRVPQGFMRDSCRQSIEDYARRHGLHEVTLEIAEAGLAESRKKMTQMHPGKKGQQSEGEVSNSPAASLKDLGGCPFANSTGIKGKLSDDREGAELRWSEDAEQRLQDLPEGLSREMTRKAVATIAAKNGVDEINKEYLESVLSVFRSGSLQVSETMPWSLKARETIHRAPSIVQGMLIKEIEGWAERHGLKQIDHDVVNTVRQEWARRGEFHLAPDDPRNII